MRARESTTTTLPDPSELLSGYSRGLEFARAVQAHTGRPVYGEPPVAELPKHERVKALTGHIQRLFNELDSGASGSAVDDTG